MGKQDSTIALEEKLSSEPRQAAVYRGYLRIQANAAERFHNRAADNLAGRLVLCADFGLEGAEMALASTIAGGAFLGIDPSSNHLRAAVRNGSCDFMVNSLDESLRVLKNELRKQTALSVGLLGLPSEIFPALVERGVQPDLIAETSSGQGANSAAIPRQAWLQLMERGAWNIPAQAPDDRRPGALVEVVWTAANAADIRHLDEIALALLPAEDPVRRRWLLQASACFRRQLPLQRVLGLHQQELTALLSRFQDEASAGKLQASASVSWDSSDGVEEMVTLHPC